MCCKRGLAYQKTLEKENIYIELTVVHYWKSYFKIFCFLNRSTLGFICSASWNQSKLRHEVLSTCTDTCPYQIQLIRTCPSPLATVSPIHVHVGIMHTLQIPYLCVCWVLHFTPLRVFLYSPLRICSESFWINSGNIFWHIFETSQLHVRLCLNPLRVCNSTS